MNIYKRIFFLWCAMGLLLQQAMPLYFILESGGRQYNSNSRHDWMALSMLLSQMPKYHELQSLINDLPLSYSGVLIDTSWALGCKHIYERDGMEPQLKFLSMWIMGREKEARATVLFRAEKFFPKDDIDCILISGKPATRTIRRVSEIALPLRRYRETDLNGKELYFVSSIVEDAHGVRLMPVGNYLAFAPCVVAENQEVGTQNPITLQIVDWTADVGYKLALSCLQGNSGGPVLIRIKDSGPIEEQFQLVGIGSVPANRSISTVICNRKFNTWIDSKIIGCACVAAQ